MVFLGCCAPQARADEGIRAEANRRNADLVKEGFNFTHVITIAGKAAALELLVPPSDDEHEVDVWMASAKAPVSIRVTSFAGEVISSWSAVRGEQRIRRKLAAGKYVIDIGAGTAEVVVGIKGPVIGRCSIDATRLTEHAAAPQHGFHWPYLLIPPKTKRPTVLLVLPNNGGFVSDDVALLRAAALCQARGNGGLEMADRLGAAVLVPIFPRPAVPGEADNLYLHALSRAALQTRVAKLVRVDEQLVAMIDDARSSLGGDVDRRVLIEGFSAAGSFTNRFTFLHPDRVLAAAVGSPGGWPLAPADLPYPVGVGDVQSLAGSKIDDAALRRLKLFFFLGGDDRNDSVPCRDSFSAADEALVMKRFGTTPVERWPKAEELYRRARLDATFKLYPGVGHMVTPEMQADVEAMFRAALARAQRR